MATYLIQVKDGTDTVGVIDPINFKNAVYYSDESTFYYIAINSVAQTFAGISTISESLSGISASAVTANATISQIGSQYGLIETTSGNTATATTKIPFVCDYYMQFSSASNAHAALAQIYTDLNTYYNS